MFENIGKKEEKKEEIIWYQNKAIILHGFTLKMCWLQKLKKSNSNAHKETCLFGAVNTRTE